MMSTPKECNICGGTEFIAAPGNRLSQKKLAPLCLKCRSLERHRACRSVALKLRIREKFSTYRLLTWGDQGNVAKGWFKEARSFPVNHPDAELGISADESVDCIVSANILERVPNHRDVVVQLNRVLSAEGFILLSYANPSTRKKTEEWNGADPKRGHTYRILGCDFETEYADIIPDAIVMRIDEPDPVTGDIEIIYVLTKNPFWMRRALQSEFDIRILD